MHINEQSSREHDEHTISNVLGAIFLLDECFTSILASDNEYPGVVNTIPTDIASVNVLEIVTDVIVLGWRF